MEFRDIAAIILLVLLLCTTSACNISDKKKESLEDEYSSLECEFDVLEYEAEELKKEIEWLEEELGNTEALLEEYENFVVLMIDDTECYHKCIDYCDAVKNYELDKEDTSTYDVVYLQIADGEGLSPCPDCYNLYID